MATIPQTRKKLRETEFFFRQLTGTKVELRLDSEEFDFYLSAFLSAGRSVSFALQVEEKKLYDHFFPVFKENLDEKDRDLLQFMNDQRAAEVHQSGAAVESVVELVPVTELRTGDRSHPVYGIQWFGPPGTPPPRIGRKARFFELGGTKEEVVETCRRYLGILKQLVDQFEDRH